MSCVIHFGYINYNTSRNKTVYLTYAEKQLYARSETKYQHTKEKKKNTLDTLDIIQPRSNEMFNKFGALCMIARI